MVKRNLTDVVAINIHFSRVSIKATDILQRRRILRRKKREKSAAYTWSQKTQENFVAIQQTQVNYDFVRHFSCFFVLDVSAVSYQVRLHTINPVNQWK